MLNSTSLSTMAGVLLGLMAPALAAESVPFPTYRVGPQADGSSVASTNQILTPAGTQIGLGTQVRVKAVALNPANPTAAVLTMGNAASVQVINLLTGMVMQTLTPSTPGGNGGSFTGITYSPDGSKLFYSEVSSFLSLAKVATDGTLTDGPHVTIPSATSIPLYTSGTAYPGGIALSADGSRAYVVMNQLNALGVVDLTQSPPKFIKQIPVGNAPHSVVLVGNKAYVTNEAGRVAKVGDHTDISSGTLVVVDPATGATNTGTISVVDVTSGAVVNTINVGLEPTGLTRSGNLLFVANSYSDTMFLIDLTTDRVIRKIDLHAPIYGGYGTNPSSIAVVGNRAYVTLSTANAIAVVDLLGGVAKPVIGYIPTGYFPTNVVYSGIYSGNVVHPYPSLVVTNDKGLGSRGSFETDYGVTAYNTHQDTGTVSVIPLPNDAQLATLTKQVLQNNHWDLKANTATGAYLVNPKAVPVAIPEHLGEPSLIKHVFLIIKENRTYDQVFGNVTKGNGDPKLAVFGNVTPNHHALAERFPLLDNFYAPSRQSADGHPWIVSGIAGYSDEIQSPDWVRSYPGGNSNDAMVYTPKGFLWQGLQQKGLSVKPYGEWSGRQSLPLNAAGTNYKYSWSDWYAYSQWLESGKVGPNPTTITPEVDVESTTIESVQPILDPHFPSFNLVQPDQYRVDYWLPQFKSQLATNTVPALSIFWIMADHTAGGAISYPTPAAEVADNDLAVGRMVEAISKSSIWGSSAILIEEDDAQNGVDHIDGHRIPAFVISPYAVQNAPYADHTAYTAANMDRTIEQIFGVAPMTQFDLVASPMRTAFTNTPNLAPFTPLKPTIALNTLTTKAASADTLQGAWSLAAAQFMTGKQDKPDVVNADLLNHSIWYASTDFKTAYPGEKDVKWPAAFRFSKPLVEADGDEAE